MAHRPPPKGNKPAAPAPSNCGDCKGFGGQYEKNPDTFQREWVSCPGCGGSGKKGN